MRSSFKPPISSHDVVVIGGGPMGLAAAWQLATRGVTGLLLEQFEIGHDRGSSRGPTRIYRYGYPEVDYVRLMQDSVSLWTELESQSGERLRRQTGAVDIGPHVNSCAGAMAECGVDIELLTAEEAACRFPSVRFQESDTILYHDEAGVCLAARALSSCAQLARDHGFEISERTRVQEVRVDGDGLVITTSRGIVAAGCVVVAAGGWTQRVLSDASLPQVHIVPASTHVAYFDASSDAARMGPVVIEQSREASDWYAYVVPGERPGASIKVGQFWKAQTPVDPDERTLEVAQEVINLHSSYVRHRLPELDPTPVHSESCLYDMTPSEDPIIDRDGNVVVAAGFSGHGFKFMPVIGKLVADLVLDGSSSDLATRFSLESHRAPTAGNSRTGLTAVPDPSRD